MSNKIKGSLISLFLGLFLQTLWANPWTLGEGNGVATFGIVWTQFDKVQLDNHSTKRVPTVAYTSYRVSLDYGLMDYLDFSVDIPYESSSITLNTGVNFPTQHKFGDTRFRLKYQFADEWDNELVSASIAVEFKTPFSDYDAFKLTSLGDGQDDLDLVLGLGREYEIRGVPVSWSTNTGYRWREDDPANEIIWGAEVGFAPAEKWWARGFYSGVNSQGGVGLESPEFFNKNAIEGRPQFPSVEEDFQLFGFGLSYQWTDDFSVSAFFTRHFESNNTSWDESHGIFISKSF